MRRLGEPDRPHEPRNDIEAHICKVLQTLTGQDICGLRTRDEDRAFYSDDQGNPIDPGYDYMVQTSTKREDSYFQGTDFGVNVTEGDITTIQETGRWRG